MRASVSCHLRVAEQVRGGGEPHVERGAEAWVPIGARLESDPVRLAHAAHLPGEFVEAAQDDVAARIARMADVIMRDAIKDVQRRRQQPVAQSVL
jgi:hypothetical protein